MLFKLSQIWEGRCVYQDSFYSFDLGGNAGDYLAEYSTVHRAGLYGNPRVNVGRYIMYLILIKTHIWRKYHARTPVPGKDEREIKIDSSCYKRETAAAWW